MTTQTLKVLNASLARHSFPTTVPESLAPGDLLVVGDAPSDQYMCVDKSWGHDGKVWAPSYTLALLQPDQVVEPELYIVRRDLLTHHGWLK